MKKLKKNLPNNLHDQMAGFKIGRKNTEKYFWLQI